MTYRVPETQIAPTFSGTFAGYMTGTLIGPFSELAGGDWLTISVSGTVGRLDGYANRPPIGVGTGTIIFNYTANLAADVFEGVSGCFADVDLRVQRDYIVVVTLLWKWNTNSQYSQDFALWANDSVTGVFPPKWVIYRQTDIYNAGLNIYQTYSAMFVLPNWKPGRYRIQLAHSPGGLLMDRWVQRGLLAVL